jgi:hypothetical protein
VYTIYPTGQIYVAVEATAIGDRPASWPGKPAGWRQSSRSTPRAPKLGLSVTFAAGSKGECEALVGQTCQASLLVQSVTEESNITQSPPYAVARSQPSDAFLLYVVGGVSQPIRLTESVSEPRTQPSRFAAVRAELQESESLAGAACSSVHHTSFVAVKDKREGDVERWSCHMLLGSASEISDREALARAVDYVNPSPPRLERGSFVPVKESHWDVEGFDPTSGCFVIAPDRGQVRFVLDGRQQPRFSPAFKIVDIQDADAWVYVDQLLFDRVARSSRGHLIFQLPGTLRKPALVEVLLRQRETNPSGAR